MIIIATTTGVTIIMAAEEIMISRQGMIIIKEAMKIFHAGEMLLTIITTGSLTEMQMPIAGKTITGFRETTGRIIAGQMITGQTETIIMASRIIFRNVSNSRTGRNR